MAVATQIEAPKKIVRRTIADGTAVPLGTLMKLEDANTVVVSAANSDPFGGIAVEEKTASDGITNIACAMDGVFMIDSTAAAITAGAIVSIGGANTVAVTTGTADQVAGSNVGQAEETRDGSNIIRVRLRG